MIEPNLESFKISKHLFKENFIIGQGKIKIELLQLEDEDSATALIRRNLEGFDEHGTVLASTYRRLTNLHATYSKDGSNFFIAKDPETGECIGGAGIGPLHGLPPSEGVAEIRDLVVDKSHRGQGIGSSLLRRCLDDVIIQKYKRVYLETTPQMKNAQKLFLRTGFRPVEEGQPNSSDELPCYFIKDLD